MMWLRDEPELCVKSQRCAEVDETNLHVTCLRAGIRGSAVSLPMLTS
jgi:hypothetical protein